MKEFPEQDVTKRQQPPQSNKKAKPTVADPIQDYFDYITKDSIDGNATVVFKPINLPSNIYRNYRFSRLANQNFVNYDEEEEIRLKEELNKELSGQITIPSSSIYFEGDEEEEDSNQTHKAITSMEDAFTFFQSIEDNSKQFQNLRVLDLSCISCLLF